MQEGNHAIRVLDNLSVGLVTDLKAVVSAVSQLQPGGDSILPPLEAGGCQLVVGDILDEALSLRVADGIDVIVHLAGNTGVGPSVDDPRADCLANVIGTLNLLEAARQAAVPRFVFASSGAPAGEVEPPIHEELPPHPVSPYGASKLAGEGYCSAYQRTFGIETIALRFGNVYGPGSTHKSSVVAKFIKRAIDGQPLEIFGDGGQTRDFIYIDDLVSAVLQAARADDVGGEIFQIATNRETTVAEMTERLVKVLQAAGIGGVEVVHGETQLGDVRRNYSDTSKAHARLGWQASTSLDEGLSRTVAFFVGDPRNQR